MKTNNRFLLAAGFVLAMAFTFSCSGDGGSGSGSSEPTYFYSSYGMEGCLTGPTTISLDWSFEDVKDIRSEIKLMGDFLESGNGLSESDGRKLLAERDAEPTDINNFIRDLKSRGNNLILISPKLGSYAYYYYCNLVVYVERE
jgi:hypothetical protein